MMSSAPCSVKDILQCARDEAMQMNHRYIGTKHILLGLLRDSTMAEWFIQQDIAPNDIRVAVGKLMPMHTDLKPMRGELPITMRAQTLVDLADKEARELSEEETNAHHVLLALLKDSNSASAKVLEPMGMTYDKLKTLLP